MTATPAIPSVLGTFQKVLALLQHTNGVDIDMNNPLPIEPFDDFFFKVAKGEIPGVNFLNINGINEVPVTDTVVGSGYATRYPFPTTTETIDLVSDDPNDDFGDTGMQAVVINGIADDDTEQLEVVALDGTNPVTSQLLFKRINFLFPFIVGSSQFNEGIITATNNGSGQKLAVIDAQECISSVSIYTTPLNKTAYIFKTLMNTAKDEDAEVRVTFTANEFTGSPKIRSARQRIYQSVVNFKITTPFPLLETNDFEISGLAKNGTTTTINAFTFLLIKDN